MSDELAVRAVIKYGGHALSVPDIKASFFAELADLQMQNQKMVLVHGGGPQINRLLDRLKIDSSFKDGLRITSESILEIVEMVLCGQTNKELVRELLASGVNAAGFSGEDGHTFLATQLDPELGRVGKIVKVTTRLVECLLKASFLPVIAPLALDEHDQPININADTAAAHLAGALRADLFILISDVPGVKIENNVAAELNQKDVKNLIENGIIHGGMIPKVDACLYALSKGCKKAVILNGSIKGNLKNFLANGVLAGTAIVQD